MTAHEDGNGQALSRRLVITGGSGSGKSTLGALLACRMGVPHIELDALYWEPHWTPADIDVFRERVRRAIEPPSWVLSGNYMVQQDVSWPAADTVVWLDLPLNVTLPRVAARTWRRSRSGELLWGGENAERLLPQFMLWNRDESIFAHMLLGHRERRKRMERFITDPRWGSLTFVRLRSPSEVDQWLKTFLARNTPHS